MKAPPSSKKVSLSVSYHFSYVTHSSSDFYVLSVNKLIFHVKDLSACLGVVAEISNLKYAKDRI